LLVKSNPNQLDSQGRW